MCFLLFFFRNVSLDRGSINSTCYIRNVVLWISQWLSLVNLKVTNKETSALALENVRKKCSCVPSGRCVHYLNESCFPIYGHNMMRPARSGKNQPCVNSNHVVSIMHLKLSFRNQSALGGLQANQHFCKWTGWTGWLAAYSVCQQRIAEKSNTALL